MDEFLQNEKDDNILSLSLDELLSSPSSIDFSDFSNSNDSQQPPTKKRKTLPSETQPLIFCTLQKEVWPIIIDNANNDVSPFINFETVCTTALSSHPQSGCLIHYKRNQLQLQFALTSNFDAIKNSSLNNFKVKNSNLTLENLCIEIQVIESTNSNVSSAVSNTKSSIDMLVREPKSKLKPLENFKYTAGFGKQNSKLYFGRATSNNGTKKQAYAYIIVSLCAYSDQVKCALQTYISIQPLIVRGGNPASYTSNNNESSNDKNELSPTSSLISSPCLSEDNSTNPWHSSYDENRGNIIFTSDRVGINNNEPNEALSVRGNIEMTGNLMKPSDIRIKRKFQETNANEQLSRIKNINLYDYERQDLATGEWVTERGVIAQELHQVLPDAVSVKGDIKLPNGQSIKDFCTVNERCLMIENIGATKALASKVDQMGKVQDSMLPALNKNHKRMCEPWALALCCTCFFLIILVIACIFSATFLAMTEPNSSIRFFDRNNGDDPYYRPYYPYYSSIYNESGYGNGNQEYSSYYSTQNNGNGNNGNQDYSSYYSTQNNGNGNNGNGNGNNGNGNGNNGNGNSGNQEYSSSYYSTQNYGNGNQEYSSSYYSTNKNSGDSDLVGLRNYNFFAQN